MKSVISTTKPTIPFPKLMEGIANPENVVLFLSFSCGVVVSNKIAAKQPICYYSTSWDMNDFTDFNGSVTLSNE